MRVLMNSRAAISGFDSPSLANRATCASWDVSSSLAWPVETEWNQEGGDGSVAHCVLDYPEFVSFEQ